MAIDVSVITPTYRREKEVVTAARSVLGQTVVTIEMIVVDDSPEGSAAAAIAEIGDPRVRYERMPTPSRGRPALVRNHGASLARGRFVHFLDDDDRLTDGALAALVGALERNPAVGVAIGAVVPFGDDEAVLARQKAYFERATRVARTRWTRLDMVACMLFDDTPLVNSVCLIRRECVQAIGGYDAEIAYCEDVEFYVRAIREFGFVFVDRPILNYRTGAPSLMHNLEDHRKVAAAYQRFHRKYRAAHGAAEFYALKLYARARREIIART